MRKYINIINEAASGRFGGNHPDNYVSDAEVGQMGEQLVDQFDPVEFLGDYTSYDVDKPSADLVPPRQQVVDGIKHWLVSASKNVSPSNMSEYGFELSQTDIDYYSEELVTQVAEVIADGGFTLTDDALTEESQDIINGVSVADFISGYIGALLWTGSDGVDDKSSSDLAPETIEQIGQDCRAFLEQVGSEITDDKLTRLSDGTVAEAAGHDFWLTRCGHGAGFWDGDWEGETNDGPLTKAATAFGNIDPYVGDDGLVYLA